MLTDRQSLTLCALMGIGIFASGVLNILDNFVVKTVLTIIFLVIVVNLIVSNSKKKEDKQ